MNRLKKLIEEHGLEEDSEHVIIPYHAAGGEVRRIFVLRRPYLIIAQDQFHRATASIEDIVEAILNNPEGSLWEELKLAEREPPDEEKEEEDAHGNAEQADAPPDENPVKEPGNNGAGDG